MKSARDMRRLVVCVSSILITAGCGGVATPGSPTGPNAPAPQTTNLFGWVTESGASASLPITGAVLTISDGANAGKTATTNPTGEYSFSQLRVEAFSVNISASGYATQSVSVDLRASTRHDFSLSLIGLRTPFGGGQFRVGEEIVAGRYFTDPLQSGCYWERQRGLSGTVGDIIASRVVAYDAMQFIVDIVGSDVAFKTDAKCGTWHDTPRHAPQSSIPPGVWLVGSQIAPGTYQVSSGVGCYWERLRHFQYQGLSGVIASSFSGAARTQSVTIDAKDVGFSTDGNCGTWTRASTADATTPEQSLADIERNRALYEQSVRHHRVR